MALKLLKVYFEFKLFVFFELFKNSFIYLFSILFLDDDLNKVWIALGMHPYGVSVLIYMWMSSWRNEKD